MALIHEGLTERIIGAAIEVHRALGPGLLESTYEVCFARELEHAGLQFARQVDLPVVYRGTRVECGYRMDFMIEGVIVVELKAVVKLEPVHTAQLLTYLRLSGKPVGLLINFHVPVLRDGIVRKVL